VGLYELRDAAGLTAVFAAADDAPPAWRARRRDCTSELETGAVRARRALAEARSLESSGRDDAAAALLESEALRTFANEPLFEATARALLAAPQVEGAVGRAVEWAARACRIPKGEDPVPCATLAAALAAGGRLEEAMHAARRAREAALARGDDALAGQLERSIQDYAREASRAGG
jgi:hypothetical protein